MVKIGFFLLSALMFITPLVILNRSQERKRVIRNYVIFFALWLTYLVGLSIFDIVNVFTFPPRVPIFIIIPAIILILYFSGLRLVKDALYNSSLAYPVYIQSFRIIVELLIYGAYLNGVFYQRVTFEGLNYDIFVGLSALVMGFLISKGKIGKSGILSWNIISLLILTLTGYSFISTYYIDGIASMEGAIMFVQMPYLLLPGVLLPFAIFYHVVSIRQVLMMREATHE